MNKACCLLVNIWCMIAAGFANEIDMNNVLRDWRLKHTDWQFAINAATSETQKKALERSRPDEVAVARNLWRACGKDLQQADRQRPYLLPAVIWFMEHPQAVAKAFSQGEQAQKVVTSCLAAIENILFCEPGIGQIAYVLSATQDLRCRAILEQIKDFNGNSQDQGLSALGLALTMKEQTGLLQDDKRLVAARGKLLKDAIIKCYDSQFGTVPVKKIVQEEMYEITNLGVGRKAPAFHLPTTAINGNIVNIPSYKTCNLLVFWAPDNIDSIQFLQQVEKLTKDIPGLQITPVTIGEPDKIANLLMQAKVDIPSLLDHQGKVGRNYRITSIPRVYLLDPQGIVLLRGTPDMLFEATLRARMEQWNQTQSTQQKTSSSTTIVPEHNTDIVPDALPKKQNKTVAPQSPSDFAPPPLRPLPE